MPAPKLSPVHDTPETQIRTMYSILARTWGQQHWWPAQSRFEMIVGAFLTQNTSWSNVELAIRKLRTECVLSLAGIRNTPVRKLEGLVRSSGYFRQKAARLKNFVRFLDENYGGSLTKMFAQPTALLREQLLALNGVGPETADSILLYAGQLPVFVVDAYTKRIAARHAILPPDTPYEEVRSLFERGLSQASFITEWNGQSGGACHSPSRVSRMRRSPLAQTYNEMHGLLVGVGKQYCLKSSPHCDACPLGPLLASCSVPG
jgi:endonuclease III related protein